MENVNISDILIDILYKMNNSPIPEEVVMEARKCILDQLGASYGGAMLISEQMKKFLDFQPDVPAGATVIGGKGRRASMEHAALMGGYAGHVFDIDDGNRFGAVHIGAAVVPAVLAVCETQNLGFDALIRGVVVGYEASVRVARCAQPSHRKRGFHASGTCGTLGAAVGCAAALGFDKEDMKSALSAGVATASGMLEMQENVSKFKPYTLGHASMNGVTAVSMVQAGFNGPVDPLGGGRGFFKCLTDEYTTEWLGKDDGHYAIMDFYHKSYAACRHCHAAIDSALEIRKNPGVSDTDNIESVTIRMYEQGAFGHDHKECPSVVAAKMSVPFSVCLALVTGAAGIPDFTEKTIKDPCVLKLLERTETVVEDWLTAMAPGRPSKVDVVMKDGTTYEVFTEVARGEPELPMSLEAFIRKFNDLMVFGGKTPEQAKKLCDTILYGNVNVSELMKELN